MIIGLVPARSGSKRVVNKNIRLLGDYPLLAWSIIASKMSQLISGTVLSTDSKRYISIGKKFGTESILRKKGISDDDSGDYGYLKEAFSKYPKADMMVILRPTTPLRDPKIIDRAITKLKKTGASGLRSAYELGDAPYKYYRIEFGFWKPYSQGYYGLGYHPNGYVDIVKRDVIKSLRANPSEEDLYGSFNLPFIVDNVGEVDREEDLDYIKWRFDKYGSPLYEYLRKFRKV